MKHSARTLHERLHSMRLLGQQLYRARYFRGHGVHSPYVYSIVRKVFMQSKLTAPTSDLHDALKARGVARRRCVQLQNLVAHCGYRTWSIDSLAESPFILCSLAIGTEELRHYADYAREHGSTLCILAPYDNPARKAMCRALVEEHPSTSVDKRGYLLLFNNHLPKQVFIM